LTTRRRLNETEAMAALTAAQIEERATTILDAQKQLQERATDEEGFAPIGREDIERGLTGGSDAMLSGFGWTLSAPPGGIIGGRVSVTFPDPAAVPENSNIYVHVWVGSGNIDPDLGTFLTNVDARFPRLTQPKVPGLRPGVTQVPELPVTPDRSLLDFQLRVPVDMDETVYLGNICLMKRGAFDVGEYLGRGSFAFRVRGADEPPDLATPPEG
jgi:hypothetical protein